MFPLFRFVPSPILRRLSAIRTIRRAYAALLPGDARIVDHGRAGLKLFIVPRKNKAEWAAGGFKRYEPEQVACFEKLIHPGDCIFDVGANVGFYAIWFSRLAVAGRVVAFEPDPANVELLRRNLELNKVCNVAVEPCAVSDYAGERRFAVDSATGSTGTLESHQTYGSRLEGGPQMFATVRTTTLDEAAREYGYPALMKIDVEGHELAVLKGARQVLGSPCLRALAVEVSNASTRTSVYALLREHGFQLRDIERNYAEAGERCYALLAARQELTP
ncbi:MAG TPA: FkbM family methyltransferase [Bryobacterales bacterium]|nr:FkbM family methyltransferase [Bryobacterales bacterium]